MKKIKRSGFVHPVFTSEQSNLIADVLRERYEKCEREIESCKGDLDHIRTLLEHTNNIENVIAFRTKEDFCEGKLEKCKNMKKMIKETLNNLFGTVDDETN